jgi:RNA polymerase sigma factor (TIGR02999 family)
MSGCRAVDEKESKSITQLLHAWSNGDRLALDELTPMVHKELLRIASRHMARERAGHTLEVSAVVNEAWLAFSTMDMKWTDRRHFFAVASRLMRRILVDHAKAKHRMKRPPPDMRESIDDNIDIPTQENGISVIDVIAIDKALAQLETHDQRAAEVVELHYFGGLSLPSIAETLGFSLSTVTRELTFGKAWLLSQLSPDGEEAMPS